MVVHFTNRSVVLPNTRSFSILIIFLSYQNSEIQCKKKCNVCYKHTISYLITNRKHSWSRKKKSKLNYQLYSLAMPFQGSKIKQTVIVQQNNCNGEKWTWIVLVKCEFVWIRLFWINVFFILALKCRIDQENQLIESEIH